MPKLIDLTGKRFGRLVVLEMCEERAKGGDVRWLCQCDCGNTTIAVGYSLKNDTKSCGCYSRDILIYRNISHGMTGSREYRAWANMKTRCLNKNDYDGYRARGITIDDGWVNSFENFYADMGDCPEGLSLDREDNDKGYSADNCRWADAYTQGNNRSDTKYINYRGKTLSYSQWDRELEAGRGTVAMRLRRGWSEVDAVSTPVGSRRKRPA